MRIEIVYKKDGKEYQAKKDSKETQKGQLTKTQLPEGKIAREARKEF